MKLKLKLNGQEIDCVIGHSLLTAAYEKLKKEKHDNFRATIDTIASTGSGLESKESLLIVLEEHIRNQIPSDGEVKAWLTSIEGSQFSLIHGTRSCPVKLNADTAGLVLDEASEEELKSLENAIMSVCYGSEKTTVAHEMDKKALERSMLEIERAELENQRIRSEINGLTPKVAE